MKALLRQFAVRFAIVLVMVGTIAGGLVWWPSQQTQKVLKAQSESIDQARQQTDAYQRSLERIEDPATLQIGNSTTAKQYANEVTNASSEVVEIRINQPKPLNFWLTFGKTTGLVNSVNQLIADQTDLYDEAGQVSANLHSLLDYHSKMMTALANMLDYNPKVDFTNFDLASDDTKTRLDLAKTGLQKELEGVNAAANNQLDPFSNELIDSIISLQTARDNLEAGGTLDDWINAVTESQAKIRSNRSAFWTGQSQPLLDQLSSLQHSLAEAAESWSFLDN